MAAAQISQYRMKLGDRLLAALDRSGLVPEHAFWIHDDRNRRWTFLAVSRHVDTHGRWAVYEALMRSHAGIGWPRDFSVFGTQLEPVRGSSTAGPILARARSTSRWPIVLTLWLDCALTVMRVRLDDVPKPMVDRAARDRFAALLAGARRRMPRAA